MKNDKSNDRRSLGTPPFNYMMLTDDADTEELAPPLLHIPDHFLLLGRWDRIDGMFSSDSRIASFSAQHGQPYEIP